jgi:SAM-dependent methyltransferase
MMSPPVASPNGPEARDFESFLEAHPLYRSAFSELAASSRLLEISAELVYETHGEALARVVDDILAFVEHTCAPGYVERYVSRVNDLSDLQLKFDSNPSVSTLGDSSAIVDADTYGLSLLLSIIFANHRFEIIQQLLSFLKLLKMRNHRGTIVSIGSGTGYELKLAAELLTGWTIQSYDTDPTMRAKAKQLLEFFQISQEIFIREYFPLDQCDDNVRSYYDAAILCEVLEHLPAPAQSLRTMRDCLKDTALMFVTMAINIAQEDHVSLYSSIDSCRKQICDSGFKVLSEWIAPQAIFALPENREEDFKKGNYVAVIEKDER